MLGLEGGAGMSGGVLAAANRRQRSTVRRVERGVWAGREAEAQVGAVDQEPHAAPRWKVSPGAQGSSPFTHRL